MRPGVHPDPLPHRPSEHQPDDRPRKEKERPHDCGVCVSHRPLPACCLPVDPLDRVERGSSSLRGLPQAAQVPLYLLDAGKPERVLLDRTSGGIPPAPFPRSSAGDCHSGFVGGCRTRDRLDSQAAFDVGSGRGSAPGDQAHPCCRRLGAERRVLTHEPPASRTRWGRRAAT